MGAMGATGVGQVELTATADRPVNAVDAVDAVDRVGAVGAGDVDWPVGALDAVRLVGADRSGADRSGPVRPGAVRLVDGVSAARSGGPAPSRSKHLDLRSAQRPPIRLTRRGRLVVLSFFLMLSVLMVIAAAPESRAADPVGSLPVAVVKPGDSLWSIADRHVPGADPIEVVDEIRRLNGLSDSTVYAGQRLKLPHR